MIVIVLRQWDSGTSRASFWWVGQEMLLSGSDSWGELQIMRRDQAKIWKIPAIPAQWTLMQIYKNRLELDMLEGDLCDWKTVRVGAGRLWT